MLDIPSALQEQFEEYLRNKPIPNSSRGAYKKWLRYYLDFCRNHKFPPIRKESLPHFIRKTRIGIESLCRTMFFIFLLRVYLQWPAGIFNNLAC